MLSPLPPRRSRAERIRARLRRPGKRLLAAFAVVAALAAVAVWRPWQGPGLRLWRTAPHVPARRTPDESRWLVGLVAWVAYVRDAQEDSTNQAVRECGRRLGALGNAPSRLGDTRALARDACRALTEEAVDRVSARASLDVKLVDKANRAGSVGRRDLALLIGSLHLPTPPGSHPVRFYSRVASTLAGQPVTVRCWPNSENWEAVKAEIARTEARIRNAAGFATLSFARVELSPEVCAGLAAVRSGKAPAAVAAYALEVLTHESQHLVGVDGDRNEAHTECLAMQRVRQTARLFNLTAADAEKLPALYRRRFYPLLPSLYHSPACRQGGPWDVHLGAGLVFP